MTTKSPFSHLTDQTLASPPGSLNGANISIFALTNSDLFILDHTAAVYVDDCVESRIRIGPVARSCFIKNCSDCIISVACQQFRAKECKNLIVFLYSASDPHMELCKGIAFAPYNFAYPLQDKHFKAAGLNPQANLWSQIYDHTPSDSEDRNWELLKPGEFFTLTYQLADLGDPVDPVPKPALYTEGTAEGFVVVGSQIQTKLQTAEESDPVILYQDDETKLAEVDLSSPEAPSFSPQPKPWAPNPPKAQTRNPVPWAGSTAYRPESGRNSSRKAQVPKANPSSALLLPPSPSETVQYRILYTFQREFQQECDLPDSSIAPFTLSQTLSNLSEAAQPYHFQIRILTLSLFCALVSGLCLLLALILIDDFVDVHNGGLAIQLFLVIVAEVGALVYIGIRLCRVIKTGNQVVRQRAEEEAVTLYSPNGLALTGDLFAVGITVKPKEEIATLLK